MNKKIKIILALIPILLIILFFLSLIPSKGSSQAIIEEDSTFNLKSCEIPNTKISNWNNQEFYTRNEPDHKYLDELKNKFIESGLSEEYLNKNIRLIYADVKEFNESNGIRREIDAWFKINTNSWLDGYNPNYGTFFPICKDVDKSNCDVCKYYITRIRGWVNLGIEGDTFPTVYSIQGKTWHDDTLVDSRHTVPFIEINKILSPWKAGLISKTCVPISLNRYGVFLSPKMQFEYVINGENLITFFNPMKHMQARINLATGEMECKSQASIIY